MYLVQTSLELERVEQGLRLPLNAADRGCCGYKRGLVRDAALALQAVFVATMFGIEIDEEVGVW